MNTPSQTTQSARPLADPSGKLDPSRLRAAFGCFTTGVCVVGTELPGGERIGATVNSFASLSLDPPLILVCLGHFMRSHDPLVGCKGFAVNVLRSDQQDLSRIFARSGVDKWNGIDAARGAQGGLILRGSLAHFDCMTHETHVSGDHTILIGRVVHFDTAGEGTPLVYFRGAYDGIASAAQRAV